MQKITAFVRRRTPDPLVTYGKVYIVRWEYDRSIDHSGPRARNDIMFHVANELKIELDELEWITSFFEWPEFTRV